MMRQRLREFWVVVTADKKKAGVLGALVLVALILWARATVTGAPSQASASSADGGGPNATAAGQQGGSPSSEKPRAEIRIAVPQPLERDLFAVQDERLASPPQPEPSEETGHKSEAGTDDKPEERKRSERATLHERVREEARRLRLRSTMLGNQPMAVIEVHKSRGRTSGVVRLGETIEGFRLIAVEARRARLEKDGVQVTLERDKY